MAKMIPENLTYYNITESEKRFYNILKELDDCYTVLYSVPWQKQSNNGRFKFNGECDFVVCHEEIGFLTIELKGGKDLKIVNNEWYLYLDQQDKEDSDEHDDNNGQFKRKLARTPVEQAKDSMYFLINYFKNTYKKEYPGVFGYSLCFPNFSIKDNLGPDAPKDIIMDSSNITNINDKISSIFEYYRKNNVASLSKDDHFNFLKLIKLKRHYKITKGSLIRKKDEIFENINRIQDFYLNMISGFNSALVSGGAGTGKTFCAIKKAKRSSLENKKVLFLCFNKNLATYIKDTYFSEDKIECYHYFEFIKKVVGSQTFEKLFNKEKVIIEGLRNEINSKKYNLPKYDAIIVDEGQDFDADWYECIDYFLDSPKEGIKYVFYDRNQDIFEGSIDRLLQVFSNSPFFLSENLRNCRDIQNLIIEKTGYGKDVTPNLIEGVVPVIHEAHSYQRASDIVSSIIEDLVVNELIEFHQIVILSDRKLEKSILKGSRVIGKYKLEFNLFSEEQRFGSIKFSTLQSYKGLESDVVVYLQHDNNNLLYSNRLNYVGYSRARYLLYIIKCMNKN